MKFIAYTHTNPKINTTRISETIYFPTNVEVHNNIKVFKKYIKLTNSA